MNKKVEEIIEAVEYCCMVHKTKHLEDLIEQIYNDGRGE